VRLFSDECIGASWEQNFATSILYGLLEFSGGIGRIAREAPQKAREAQERDDWSKSAREASRDMLESIRAEKFVYLRDLDLSEEMREEIEDVMALYRAINLTFITRLYGMSSPPTSTRPSPSKPWKPRV